MLSLLQIENIATIEKAAVEFSPGLNILTGETGAGKSILIDSINAVLGAKTSRELIRSGESTAGVSAFFTDISAAIQTKIEEMGLPSEADGTLNLRRKLYKDGKNACFVNGVAVTVSMLRSIAFDLINIHGQRDAQALLQGERHLDYLDVYAGNAELRKQYTDAFLTCKKIRSELRALQMDEAYKARQLDLLNYQIGELESANIREGEIEDLRHRKNVITNSVKVRTALEEAVHALLGADEDPGVDTLLQEAVSCILHASDVAKGLGPVAQSLEEAKETVLDAASVLDDALGQLGDSAQELEEIEERLDLLYRLSKKYGDSENEMLSFLANAQKEYDAITFADERTEALQTQYEKEAQIMVQIAEALSAARTNAAAKLAQAVTSELRFLDMPNVRFVVSISDADYSERGKDAVLFLFSANAGEEPKALGKVASGGELSRVMLALKNVLRTDDAATMIFDEIDAGVSGSAAGKIAQKLASLASDSQVLCITHSAQIAAYADVHKRIYKSVVDNKTYTEIETLSPEARAAELAKITFGASPSETQVESSRQLISQAETYKNSK